jgi:RimJ/RimL family protein N-acetyltransferase
VIPVIETERLKLREWRLSDADPFVRFFADREFSRFVGGPLDAGKAWQMMATEAGHWELRGFGMWVVEVKGGPAFAGYCGLWEPGDWPETEIGWIFSREHHGKGYATEAGRRVRDWAYRELKKTTLVSYIHPENEASKQVAKRLGAFQEKRMQLRGHPVEVFRHPAPESIT